VTGHLPAAEVALPDKSPAGGRFGLALCAIGIVAIWGWVLPAIGSLASVSAAIQRTEGQGINAGAIFYTDVFYTLELRRANQLVDQR
jgi:hypothetical protein